MVDIIALHSKAENIVISTIYRQSDDSTHNRPSTSSEFKSAISALQNSILKIDGTPDIFIGGDFNLPHVSWPECTPKQGCPRDERAMVEILHNFSNEILLSQIITKPTHYQGNTLDLVLTNCKDIINDYDIQPTTLSISHHYIINLFTQYKASTLPAKENFPRLSPLDYYNFHSKETNWDNIQTYFEHIDWENTLQDKLTSEILEIIYKKTTETTKVNVPPKKDPNNKQISKQKRIHMNLAQKRRRINKQYHFISF